MSILNTSNAIQEGQSSVRPPFFNGENYTGWKNRMEIFIKSEDYQVWQIVKNGPLKIVDSTGKEKDEDKWNDVDFRKMEKNAKAIKFLHCALGIDEFNKISASGSAKEIWDALQIANEGSDEVKLSKIDLLVQQYESFEMKKNESIKEMFTRFTIIINDLKSLGRIYSVEDQVRKILRSLPNKWMPKVTAIQEAKDLSKLPLEQLMGSLMTHEMILDARTPTTTNLDRGLAFKANDDEPHNEFDEDDLVFAIGKIFKFFKDNKSKKFLNENKNNLSSYNNGKQYTNDGCCYKCRKPGHGIRECPLWEIERKNEKRAKLSKTLDKVFANLGNGEGEEENESEDEHSSSEANLALMANSDIEDDSDGDFEVTFLELKSQIASFSKEKFIKVMEIVCSDFQDTAAKIKEEIKITKYENKTLQEENTSLIEKNSLLEKDNNNLLDKIKNIESRYTTLHTQKDSLLKEFDSLQKSLQQRSAELESLQKSLQERSDELERLRQKVNFVKESESVEISQYTERLETTKERLNVLDSENKRLKQELFKFYRNETHKENLLYIGQKAYEMYVKHVNKPTNQGIRTSNKNSSNKKYRKYVGVPKYRVCMHCGLIGHYSYECAPKSLSYEKNKYVIKQVWVRKDSLHVINGTNPSGPKQVWVPKTKN